MNAPTIGRPDAHLHGAGAEGQGREALAGGVPRRDRPAPGPAGELRPCPGRARGQGGRGAAAQRAGDRLRRLAAVRALRPHHSADAPGRPRRRRRSRRLRSRRRASPSAAPPAHAQRRRRARVAGPPARRAHAPRRWRRASATTSPGVRVHDDARAAATAAGIDAAAFTVGEDVAFGAGPLRPVRAEGRARCSRTSSRTSSSSAPTAVGSIASRRRRRRTRRPSRSRRPTTRPP